MNARYEAGGPNPEWMAERAQHWFRRVGEAVDAAKEGTVPRMSVTPAELEELRQYGTPFKEPWFDEIAMYAGVALDMARDGNQT